ncbi:MAG: ABC transporter ATP-binding protein [Caldilineaceae bacterium SB0664_bin_27]|uniref:ABC transporter ATP-binding protein n=1 Tax=Caldilineaceae bacterium SB0664_bin_27 TaxID=2605260 RepID=A0A6B0YT42_9CHLR|nr:ABC transporter ATP-binding protein [Caldilineaceae bacterium SB0664_bin_27]
MTLTAAEASQPNTGPEGAIAYAWRKARSAAFRAVTVGLAWEVTVVIVPFLAQRAIDEGLVPRDWRRLSIWVAALIASGVLTAILSGMRNSAATRSRSYGSLGLRGHLFRHVLGLDAGFHDRADRGDLLTRMSTDISAINNFIGIIATTVAYTSGMVLTVFLMLRMNPSLGLIGTAFIPVVVLLSAVVKQAYESRTVALREAAASLTAILHENIFGVRVIRGFGVEPHQRSRYEPASSAIAARAMALVRLETVYTIFGGSLPALAMVGLLWWGGRLAVSGEVTVGMLLAFSAWMVQLTNRIAGLLERFNFVMQAKASADRINAVLSVEAAIADPPRAAALPPSGGGLRFSNVSVKFGERRILDGVSLDVRAGETVVLTGRSGSGKSILLSLPPRLYDPGEGGVFLDGVDVRDLCLETLRSAVCLASDDAVLFNDTIAANISLGRPDASQAEIEQAAQLAQAHRFITEMPDGYDAGIGERGLTLSGGQRQRIVLARALLVGPRLLLLDDASSSLDPATDAAVWQGLTGREQKRTMLVATQRRSVAARGDRVVLLDAGRIAAEGTDEELWRTSPLYRQVLSSGDEQ